MVLEVVLHVFISDKDGKNTKEFPASSFVTRDTWTVTANTATITLPRKLMVNVAAKGVQLRDTHNLIKQGQRVRVDAGYNVSQVNGAGAVVTKSTVETVFTGYVAKLNLGSELALECMDESYGLTRFTFSMSERSITLSQLMSALKKKAGDNWLYKDVKIRGDRSLGKLLIDPMRADVLLDELRKKWYVDSWVRDGVLHIGEAYDTTASITKPVDLSRHATNIDSLQWIDEPVPMRVKAVGMVKGKAKYRYTVGDPDGHQVTLVRHFSGANAKAEFDQLKGAANAIATSSDPPGYQGEVEIFGYPRFRHSYVADLTNPSNTARNGNYIVKEVVLEVGETIRQRLTLDGRR